jgi:CRISPR-associated protein Csm4
MAQGNAACWVRLTLKGPLHVGRFVGVEREAVLDWVPADTLFGALVSAWAFTGHDVATYLETFVAGDPPFLLTSAFPLAGPVRFYPRPWLRPRPPDLLAGARKRIKRLRWVSAGVFGRLLAGESLAGEAGDDNFVHNEAVWLTRAERAQLPPAVLEEGHAWRNQTVPHVTVDRSQARSNLFHAGRVDFAAECGLWFAVRYRRDEALWQARLRSALDYLAGAGLGGLRSTGHGAFEWGAADEPVPDAAGASHAVTLSRYAPRDVDELRAALLAEPRAAYGLVLVGGWCRDGVLHAYRRRSVRMVDEGSVLAWPTGAVLGHAVDVTPQGVGQFGHRQRVLRYGYAYPVPVAPAALQEVPQ